MIGGLWKTKAAIRWVQRLFSRRLIRTTGIANSHIFFLYLGLLERLGKSQVFARLRFSKGLSDVAPYFVVGVSKG